VRTRFLVLRHAKEAEKSSNTARWASLLLPGCELLPWHGRTDVSQLQDVGADGDWLLFPKDAALPGAGLPGPAPARGVVLDGTWRQARRMLRALPALHGAPRLSVGPRPGGVGLRAAPSPDHLSTLEAISSAVAVLESEALATVLDGWHRELVARALRARGRPLPEAA
jgi:DTW domain-containing protein YfiP